MSARVSSAQGRRGRHTVRARRQRTKARAHSTNKTDLKMGFPSVCFSCIPSDAGGPVFTFSYVRGGLVLLDTSIHASYFTIHQAGSNPLVNS